MKEENIESIAELASAINRLAQADYPNNRRLNSDSIKKGLGREELHPSYNSAVVLAYQNAWRIISDR